MLAHANVAEASHEAPAIIPRLDHAAIGNGRVLALVSPTSAVEWLCLPSFDSPSFFGRILDRRQGGTFRILAGDDEVQGRLGYLRNTNVARGLFQHEGSSWEVVDFAPRIPEGLGVRAPYALVRILRPVSGQPRLRVDFDPRPDYAREVPSIVPVTDGLEIAWPGHVARLVTNMPVPFLVGRREFVLDRPIFFVLTYGGRAERRTLASVLGDLELTVAGWQAWSRTCALPTFAPEAVLRSALCLKLHAFHDTGAIIAAATTSIPEAMGTQRTWDYRYCWLRDAAFVVEALRRLSHVTEGEQFIRFLRDVAASGPLQPLYAIDGGRDLEERLLPHLAGFGGNGHVRVGNAAAIQRQHDLMGELVLCLETLLGDPRIGETDVDGYFPLLERLVEEAIVAAPIPDTGIWEFRTMLRPYTFSRAMCWVAVQRGALLANRYGRASLAERWHAIADHERAIVLRRGYSARHGFFTQALDGEHPDAANLLLPAIGLVDARDPRFVSTVDRYERELVSGGLMLRYRNADDFGATTSAFTICSFWWAEALALIGRLDEAAALFNRLVSLANPVGLFSEDIEPGTGTLLGNFPQAYTHVGLIHAAMTIGELLEARDGKVRAWT